MNLVSLLDQRAAEHPDRPALIDRDGRQLTYAELANEVAACASHLEKGGLGSSRTLLIFHPVSLELYVFLLGVFRAGGRAMLADPSAGREFLTLCCERVPPDGFFGSFKARLFRWTVPALRRIPRVVKARSWARETGGGLVDVPDDAPALITFTSGSTGQPKAAVRTHGFLIAQQRVLAQSLDFEEGEVDLVTLPVFVLANLASGLTSVLARTDLAKPAEPDSAAIREQCRQHHVTRCAASPAFFQALANDGAMDFHKVYTGGGPVFPELLRLLTAKLPAAKIEAVYGSTEAEPMAHTAFHEDDALVTRRGGGLCVGKPVPEIEARILRDTWGESVREVEFATLILPLGQAGEIVVSGPHVLPGYLDGRGDEETKIRVGGCIWHRTGDAGWMDERGRLWLLGRCAEKLPPHKAPEGLPEEAARYPFAIECALREVFPGVPCAALDWEGQRTLVVAGDFPPTQRALIHRHAEALGMQRVAHLPSLPMDRRHGAKIDYPKLRQLLG